MRKEENFNGTFEVNSGAIRVSDPCYGTDVWCQGVVENVLNGKWKVEVIKSDEGSWGIRCKEIVAHHESITYFQLQNWKPNHEIHVGVDSGQAGFYDRDSYRKDRLITEEPTFTAGHEGDGDLWYDACCELTLSEESAGIIAGTGVVSSSGYGDGSYPLFQITNEEGHVVALRLEFIGDEDETDNDEYHQCKNCDTEFEYDEGDGNFCSSECRREYEEEVKDDNEDE